MSGVLVTGGCGYLGSLAVAALHDAGVAPLVSLDVRPPSDPLGDVTYVTADLREVDLAGLLRQHDVAAVVHLAAIVSPPPDMTPQVLHDIEVGGTRRVIEACVSAGVEHLTVASSGAAYGYTPANRERPRTESDPVPGHPRFAYSRHKAEVEALLAAARDDHPELGQLVLRPGTILGAGTDNQITRLFTGRVVLGLTDTDVPFVFVHDGDVAEVIVRGATGRVTGIVNLAGDGVLTLRDIAAIEGARYVPLRPGLVAGALRAVAPLHLLPYGPEQVDFLRYRPVLANERCKQLFPGLPRLSSAECYERFRQGRL
ncbi:MAG TPA: NAD-dependent epimerase/dehydratase family protein [Egicoccus sp.]|nr:NAD-dependent epimerase/dehydratase family protein [Egicoccus sp.]HSK22516.1 NAD-dependent epimerase/dehydratase family protein [Egicoccus sp.]